MTYFRLVPDSELQLRPFLRKEFDVISLGRSKLVSLPSTGTRIS